MTEKQEKSEPSTQSRRISLSNPAKLELTAAQAAVYKIVRSRQMRNKTTTSTNVTKDRGLKDRSSTYRVLKSLIELGLIETYAIKYYKLAEQKKD